MPAPLTADVLVVGAGPAGSAAAAWSARAGRDTLVIDAARFPRDKTCGDGLTPRAIHELDLLGLSPWVDGHGRNRGLRAAGFGQELLLPWPGDPWPDYGSAVARTELDEKLLRTAVASGARAMQGTRAVDAERSGDGRVTTVIVEHDGERRAVACRQLIVADGVRSTLGKVLGRQWHRDTAYGVAGRSYLDSERSDDPWISSHLELRNDQGDLLPGYGWIFPLNNGSVNLGVGALATAKRPAALQLRPLMEHYARRSRDEWRLGDELRMPTSALLPMGGAVSGVAGPNWILIGDAAGCVNPLNGEGIDYGMETGRLGADLLVDASAGPLDQAWPALLRANYGEAFSIARRLSGLLTVPWVLPGFGPIGMRSHRLMTVALRVMGNLITDADRDLTARAWRFAGRQSLRIDDRPPFS